jgi:hypothetical protein
LFARVKSKSSLTLILQGFATAVAEEQHDVPYIPVDWKSSQKPAILPISPMLKGGGSFRRSKNDEAPCYLRPLLAITYESVSLFLWTMTQAQSSLSYRRRILIVDEYLMQDASTIQSMTGGPVGALCLLF